MHSLSTQIQKEAGKISAQNLCVGVVGQDDRHIRLHARLQLLRHRLLRALRLLREASVVSFQNVFTWSAEQTDHTSRKLLSTCPK